MSFRLRTFRRILLGLIMALSFTTIILSICLRHSLSRRVFCLVVLLQSACILRSLWSVLSKCLLKLAQSVTSETISLFILLPFELILALVVTLIPFQRDTPSENQTYRVLHIFILISAAIGELSFGGMVSHVIAMTTACAYDQDVWLRDIDSSPSPFPIPILFSYVFRRRDILQPTSLCLPGCNCTVKLQPTPILSHESLVRIPREAERRASIIVAFSG